MRVFLFTYFPYPDFFSGTHSLKTEDLLIGVDSGAEFLFRNDLIPKAIIGDFDSLDSAVKQFYQGKTTFIDFPQDKDFTDTELALQYALDLAPSEIILINSLDKRFDHALGVVGLLQKYADKNIPLSLESESQKIIYKRNSFDLNLEPGTTISLIPLHGKVCGIKTTNLKYPLMHETLELGSTRGLSNVALQDKVRVEFTSGELLVVINESI